ncbi:hypothetical protein F5148DRAFT_1287320 [Russula earlei]|uniref:Uncharacterized protein n=1 Tax=Russula earlei TaxID=71964 RepID=A0ACC0U3I7_9AGAM|nr:hypothetical protein F5148DRAFT_1287320 [Russula earlei]
MANLIPVRSAKSGSEWTLNDLESYHISLSQVEPLPFFGLQELPQPSVDQELLTIADAAPMRNDRHAELITLLDLAMMPQKGDEPPWMILSSNSSGLWAMFIENEWPARGLTSSSLSVANPGAQRTDVCIVDRSRNDVLLVVQEDRRLENREPVNARAQLVAEAVAAFNENNIQRDAVGLPPFVEKARDFVIVDSVLRACSSQVIPGIVMVGTSPSFFKIPVTQSLSTHIRHGTYPPEVTCVTYCYPPVPRPARRLSEGMKPLDNRREILKCYEAFKAIVGI